MSRYVLTDTAQRDLVDIRDYYLGTAGARVAGQLLVEFVAAFRFLARNSGAGHTREGLAGRRAVRFWAVRDYLIVYADVRPLEIVTIARGSRDIAALLESRKS